MIGDLVTGAISALIGLGVGLLVHASAGVITAAVIVGLIAGSLFPIGRKP